MQAFQEAREGRSPAAAFMAEPAAKDERFFRFCRRHVEMARKGIGKSCMLFGRGQRADFQKGHSDPGDGDAGILQRLDRMDIGPATKAEATGGGQDIARHINDFMGNKGRVAGAADPEKGDKAKRQKTDQKWHRNNLEQSLCAHRLPQREGFAIFDQPAQR